MLAIRSCMLKCGVMDDALTRINIIVSATRFSGLL
jgi:hypothetical protein